MITIAICDDEAVEIAHLAFLARKWAAAREVDVRLLEYANAERFLFAYEEDPSVDFLLLDIQMKSMDGVTLARQIRRDNESMQIVFATGYPDFVFEGYDVSALHYLLKPVGEDKLFSVLDKALKNRSKSRKDILLDVDGGMIRLSSDEIIFMESFDHFVEIHTTGQKHTVKIPLREIESKLTGDFIRCHRSYIVNMSFIKRITRTEVTLDSGASLPLSRRLYADVNKAMIKFLTGRQEP